MKDQLRKLSKEQLLDKMIDVFEETNFIVNRKLNSEQLKALLPESMTIEQKMVLRYLRTKKTVTSSELADYLCVNKSTITSTINRMVSKGLIVRHPSEEDRRVTYLSMTKEAEQLLEYLTAEVKKYFMPFLQSCDLEQAVDYISSTSYMANVLKLEE